VGEAKANAVADENLDVAGSGFLVRNAEGIPPVAELVGVLDGDRHREKRIGRLDGHHFGPE